MNTQAVVIVPYRSSSSSGRVPCSPEGKIAYGALLFVLMLPFTALFIYLSFQCVVEIVSGKVKRFGALDFFISLFLFSFTLVVTACSVGTLILIFQSAAKL